MKSIFYIILFCVILAVYSNEANAYTFSAPNDTYFLNFSNGSIFMNYTYINSSVNITQNINNSYINISDNLKVNKSGNETITGYIHILKNITIGNLPTNKYGDLQAAWTTSNIITDELNSINGDFFSVGIQNYVTGESNNSYQRDALYVISRLNQSSTDTIYRDAVGIDGRAIITGNNQYGRLWGMYSEAIIPYGTDALAYGFETTIRNGGSSQINSTNISKTGIHIVISNNSGTLAIHLDKDPNTPQANWSVGLYAADKSIGKNFLELANSTNITAYTPFSVSKTGRINIEVRKSDTGSANGISSYVLKSYSDNNDTSDTSGTFQYTNSANGTQLVGRAGKFIALNSGTNGTISNIRSGDFSVIGNMGTNTTLASGLYTGVYGSGITTSSGITIDSVSANTTGYGIYIGNIYGNSKYGVYQSNSSNPNYFAGDIITNMINNYVCTDIYGKMYSCSQAPILNLLASLTPTFSGWAINPGSNSNISDELNNSLTISGKLQQITTIQYDLGSSVRIQSSLYAEASGAGISYILISYSDDGVHYYTQTLDTCYSLAYCKLMSQGKARFVTYQFTPMAGTAYLDKLSLKTYLI